MKIKRKGKLKCEQKNENKSKLIKRKEKLMHKIRGTNQNNIK